MDDAGERSQSNPGDDGQRNFVDHLARVTRNDGRAENAVGPFLDMDFHETGFFAVGDRATDLATLWMNLGVIMDL